MAMLNNQRVNKSLIHGTLPLPFHRLNSYFRPLAVALHRASGTNHKPIILPPGNINVSETCLFKQLAMCIDTWMLMNDMISQEKMAWRARGQSVRCNSLGVENVSLNFDHPSTELCFPHMAPAGQMGHGAAQHVLQGREPCGFFGP